MTNAINSESYWDTRFSNNWELHEGPRQSRFFAQLAVTSLPSWLMKQINTQSLTFVDWGCAQGDGTAVWTNYLNPSLLTGVDFSVIAIEQAKIRYPEICFSCENWLDTNSSSFSTYDVVFSSNTLEHFHEPYPVLDVLARHAKKMVVLALPYREIDRIDEHFYSFFPDNIPIKLQNGFRLVCSDVIQCKNLPNTLWGGEQLFLIYAEASWLDTLHLSLEDVGIHKSDYEFEFASLSAIQLDYKEQVTNYIQKLNQLNRDVVELNRSLLERENLLNFANEKLNEIQVSRSWRITLPFRYIGSTVRTILLVANLGNHNMNSSNSFLSSIFCKSPRINYVLSRIILGFRRHGFFRAIPKAFLAAFTLFHQWISRIVFRTKYKVRLNQLTERIKSSHSSFVDIFHIPMGWSTPLFQRFQHMSLQATSLGGLALYGGHIQVDKDMHVFKQAEGGVIVFDALDGVVVKAVFDALKDLSIPKIIRLQSIDLATKISDIEKFIKNDFVIIYEYIDEISDEITGTIPEFVIHRHKWILENTKIHVIATSTKLHHEVTKYRSEFSQISTNGVDVKHWRQPGLNIPTDMEVAKKSGKCVVGYHGALAKWIDYDLIRKIANHGNYYVVLIGYEHDDSFKNSGLSNHSRVSYLGSKSYFVLNQYAAQYDVAILPFKKYELTESVSPVKLFEYMAAGKPIVTTDLRECHKYKSCFISASDDQFMENLQVAAEAQTDQVYQNLLQTEAESNSWREKAASMFSFAGVQNLPVTEINRENLGLVKHDVK